MIKEREDRRSIRKYKPDRVNKTIIEDMIYSATLAPSAKNRQPWKYYVYTDEKKEKLLDCMEKGLIREGGEKKLLPQSQYGLPDAFHTLKIMREAPVLIMIENTNGTSPYLGIDTDRRVSEICDTLSIGASVQNILLTATELGYGTLWIANTCFAYNELVELTGMKGQLVGAISLGVAAESPAQRPRKDFTEVVEFC